MSSAVHPLRIAPRTCKFSSRGLLSAVNIARLMRLRTLRSSPGRDHTAPQQYSVMSSWRGRLNSVARPIERSTYSSPNTLRRISSPLAKRPSASVTSAPCLCMSKRLYRHASGGTNMVGASTFSCRCIVCFDGFDDSRDLLYHRWQPARLRHRGRSKRGNTCLEPAQNLLDHRVGCTIEQGRVKPLLRLKHRRDFTGALCDAPKSFEGASKSFHLRRGRTLDELARS